MGTVLGFHQRSRGPHRGFGRGIPSGGELVITRQVDYTLTEWRSAQLLLIDLVISGYDRETPLPSKASRLLAVHPSSSTWPFTVHLACTDAPNRNRTHHKSLLAAPRSSANVPTILYESPSGVPGSLALLDVPLPPGSEDAENPGRWIFDLQQRGELGRVCVWDRPGYGFSEVMNDADLGGIADALWLALNQAGEIDGRKFMLVGEGYGG